MLVPFTEEHARLLVKENIIIKRGGNEAAEIRYIHITKNSQGMEEIEVQRKVPAFVDRQAHFDNADHHEGHDTEHSIRHCETDLHERRSGAQYPEFQHIHRQTQTPEAGRSTILRSSTRTPSLRRKRRRRRRSWAFGFLTNARTGKHTFSVYEGRDLTAGNTAGNAPCIFSQEFDNIVEQEYTNSVENLKTTAYVGEEEKEGVTRKVAEVGGSSTGLSRDEVFINATDIVQEYENERADRRLPTRNI